VTASSPKRPPYFACQFVRELTKRCVANELGTPAFTLLVVVAMTEDARGYVGAVTFFNEQLLAQVGLGSIDSLDRVRAKCVTAGWLRYTRDGGRRGPGTYRVEIPTALVNTTQAGLSAGCVLEGRSAAGDGEWRTPRWRSRGRTPIHW
jgi:hypothetical protein